MIENPMESFDSYGFMIAFCNVVYLYIEGIYQLHKNALNTIVTSTTTPRHIPNFNSMFSIKACADSDAFKYLTLNDVSNWYISHIQFEIYIAPVGLVISPGL